MQLNCHSQSSINQCSGVYPAFLNDIEIKNFFIEMYVTWFLKKNNF